MRRWRAANCHGAAGGRKKTENLLLLRFRTRQVTAKCRWIPRSASSPNTRNGTVLFSEQAASSMLFCKSVLAVADSDSELAHVVKDSECGYVVEPDHVDALASTLMEMCSPEKQRVMGQNGRTGFHNMLSKLSRAILKTPTENCLFIATTIRRALSTSRKMTGRIHRNW